MSNFSIAESHAIKMCDGFLDVYHEYKDPNKKLFSLIYPFTTENISGYLPFFDLENKSLLTIGSSGDQAINAVLNNCFDITILDINEFSKYYFYLKKAGLIKLSYYEFLEFFCYKNYPKTFTDNDNVFNLESYNKLKESLRLLDYESFLFWDELFCNYNPVDIRKNMFEMDEDKLMILKHTNKYLSNESNYLLAREKIKKVRPTFISDNIFNTIISRKFDNINLSNIGQYLKVEELKELVEKYDKNLNSNGTLLICYLYQTKKDTKYDLDWSKIYDLENTYEVFGKYITNFESFIGVRGIKFKDENIKDSVLLYKK